jgi:hypothetical protein
LLIIILLEVKKILIHIVIPLVILKTLHNFTEEKNNKIKL